MKKSRREFLKQTKNMTGLTMGMALASSPFLQACQSIDLWVSGEARDNGRQVTIIGAGLAGLSAALELKKNKIPYRLYEGSQRAGGRVLTLKDANISGVNIELGAERIETDWKTFVEIAQELKVPLEEVETPEMYGFYEKGAGSLRKDFGKEINKLQVLMQNLNQDIYGRTQEILSAKSLGQFPKAEAMDRMSVSDLIQKLSSNLSMTQKNFLEQLSRTHWGAEPHDLSSLHLIHYIRDDLKVKNKKIFRVVGGNAVLVQALLDRVYGIIPDRNVRFEHSLVAIKRTEEGWRLTFKLRDGYKEVMANRIICTLPISQIKKIEGWQTLPIPAVQKEYIETVGFAGHGKLGLGFESRLWGNVKGTDLGMQYLVDSHPVLFSEATPPKSRGFGAVHGVIQAQWGGLSGEQIGLHTIKETLELFDRLANRAPRFENISRVQNWRNHPWSGGSKTFLKPGQFQKFSDFGVEDQLQNEFPFLLAGEAFNLPSLGTMNGALVSGKEMAKLISAVNPVKSIWGV